MINSILSLLSAPPLSVAITKSGFKISISESTWISAAVTTQSPVTSICATLGSSVVLLFLISSCLMFNTISVTSSFTPGTELNSWRTPSILIWLTADPGNDESIILLKALPSVVP